MGGALVCILYHPGILTPIILPRHVLYLQRLHRDNSLYKAPILFVAHYNYIGEEATFLNFDFNAESGNSTGQFVKLGLINCSGLSLLNGKSREHIIWGDTIPSDGSTIIELRYTELAVTVVTYIFAGCNIIIAIAGMLFMTVYKKRRSAISL